MRNAAIMFDGVAVASSNLHRTELLEGALTRDIIAAFYEVYNTLDFGFREDVYKAALDEELVASGHVRQDNSTIIRARLI